MSTDLMAKSGALFFFQAKDGIRDLTVTGVQTCALPICPALPAATRVKPEEAGGRPRSRDRSDDAARLVDEGSAGLPVGVQVAGKPGRDDQVLEIGRASCRERV